MSDKFIKATSIKGNRIDIFMNSESEAREWGVRKIEIQILE